MNEQQDDSVGWEEEVEKIEQQTYSLNALPADWSKYKKANKVQILFDTIQHQILKVRSGSFDLVKSQQVAALCLEALMELSEFYSDAESRARDAKNIVEYTEGEVAIQHRSEQSDLGQKVSEQALKRFATCDSKVKEARLRMNELEKEHRKWRYVYETLKEAHIFFRNLTKV
jgi:hypothetical protein